MNVMDSSAWLEYFADGPNAEFFAPVIEKTGALVVPSLTIYEVYRKLLGERSETEALIAAAAMQQGKIVDLDAHLSMAAARLSRECRLPLADSIILATARAAEAVLWTQDADFKGMAGVKFFPK